MLNQWSYYNCENMVENTLLWFYLNAFFKVTDVIAWTFLPWKLGWFGDIPPAKPLQKPDMFPTHWHRLKQTSLWRDNLTTSCQIHEMISPLLFSSLISNNTAHHFETHVCLNSELFRTTILCLIASPLL